MPEMDGFEFLRYLDQEHHNIAIVIVSALGGKLLISAGRMTKIGVKLLGAIEKPILLDQLKDLFSKYERSENKWHQPAESVMFTLEEILRAIHAQQFEPFFQPKVDLKTKRMVAPKQWRAGFIWS